MPRCILFAYGLLKPGYRPPRTTVDSWPDEVHGELYDLGPYPAAVEVGTTSDRFHGFALDIDEEELRELDEFEAVPDGQYIRMRVVTVGGRDAWIYQYNRALPPHSRRVFLWEKRKSAPPREPDRQPNASDA